MAVDDVTDSRLGVGELSLGAVPDEFAMQVTNCRLEPSHEESEARGTLGKPNRAATVKTTWILAGSVVQDWELDAPEGFLEYCRVHNGEEVPFTFVPSTAHAKQYTGTVQIRATTIGGEVDVELSSDFSLPVVGDITRGEVVP
jgi:hypothetical protein